MAKKVGDLTYTATYTSKKIDGTSLSLRLAEKTHTGWRAIMSNDSKVNFFYQDIMTDGVTSFAIGRTWLYLYGPTLMGVRSFLEDGDNKLYLLTPGSGVKGQIDRGVVPETKHYEAILQGDGFDRESAVYLTYDELCEKAHVLVLDVFSREIDSRLTRQG